MKIYHMDDCDWYAADSEEQAKSFYEEQSFDGNSPDEEGLWGLTAGMYRFSIALPAAIASGETAPFLFASTEQ